MADVKHKKLGNIFPESVFEIPKYQRGYSWTRREVNDLLEDISYAYQERTNNNVDFTHYFGTIVLHDTGVIQGETDDFANYDVIDGQQRISTICIIISCLIEEIEYVSEFDLSNTGSVDPDRLAQENKDDFISKHGTVRVQLDSINNESFEKLVVDGDLPCEVPDDNLPQRRLAAAKQTVEEWFENKRKEFEENVLQHNKYYQYLLEIGRTIRNALEITTYIIEDETEAGRLFEVVNDRGRNLTALDRIKSYLIYCTARENNNQLANKVYRKFGEVIQNITKHGGDDDEIDVFVRSHWLLFSGEINRSRRTEYSKIHRRIKHLQKHAERNQTKSEIRNWINSYLDSLTTCSEAFSLITNPNSLDPENRIEQRIKSKLDGLNQLSVSRNFYPLLMVAYRKYGLSQKFSNIVSLSEIFSFRVYNVAGRRTDAAINPLQRHAYWMEWAGRQQEAKSIFSNEETPVEYDSEQEALQKTCKMFESQIGKHCPDAFLISRLLRDDVLDGKDKNDNWTGVRNNTVLMYLLYKYEKHLRRQGQRSNIPQIPPFSRWKDEGITIEHIYPQNPADTDSDEMVEQVINSVGNLLLLGPEDNSSANNSDYETKYENIYSNSTMELVSKLPTPKDGWSKKQIRDRAKKITEFAVSEWDNLSTAHVHMSNNVEDFDISDLTDLADMVRTEHGQRYRFRVPSVKFRSQSVNRSEEWSIANSCPHCDGTIVDLNPMDEWKIECGGCGANLNSPSYKFRKGEFR